MSVSLRGRRFKEMTQLNTSSPSESEVPFESHRGVLTINIHGHKQISGGKRMEGEHPSKKSK